MAFAAVPFSWALCTRQLAAAAAWDNSSRAAGVRLLPVSKALDACIRQSAQLLWRLLAGVSRQVFGGGVGNPCKGASACVLEEEHAGGAAPELCHCAKGVGICARIQCVAAVSCCISCRCSNVFVRVHAQVVAYTSEKAVQAAAGKALRLRRRAKLYEAFILNNNRSGC